MDFINERWVLPSTIKEYELIDDPSKGVFIISDVSEPIDVTLLMKKYNRINRNISESAFLQNYTRAAMIRLALLLLKKISGKKILIDQRNQEKTNIFGDCFWSDNGAFLWSIEYANQFCFRVHCQISVSL